METSNNDLTSLNRIITNLPTPKRKSRPAQKASKSQSKTRRRMEKASRRRNRR
jgi:hypothetical protein